MSLKKDSRININMDYRQIEGDDLQELFEFCFKLCDTISLSQSHNIGMTKEEADQAIKEHNNYLHKIGINEGIRPSAEDMLEFYKDMAETEEEWKELVRRDRESRENYEASFKKSQEEVTSYVQEMFSEYKLIDRDVTCTTPCTSGGPHVMYYLESEERIKSCFFQMTELFDAVIKAEDKGLLLDDPTIYREGKMVLMVCSHERYASLFLTEEQYAEFKKLNIAHKVEGKEFTSYGKNRTL